MHSIVIQWVLFSWEHLYIWVSNFITQTYLHDQSNHDRNHNSQTAHLHVFKVWNNSSNWISMGSFFLWITWHPSYWSSLPFSHLKFPLVLSLEVPSRHLTWSSLPSSHLKLAIGLILSLKHTCVNNPTSVETTSLNLLSFIFFSKTETMHLTAANGCNCVDLTSCS